MQELTKAIGAGQVYFDLAHQLVGQVGCSVDVCGGLRLVAGIVGEPVVSSDERIEMAISGGLNGELRTTPDRIELAGAKAQRWLNGEGWTELSDSEYDRLISWLADVIASEIIAGDTRRIEDIMEQYGFSRLRKKNAVVRKLIESKVRDSNEHCLPVLC